ncbi:anthrax toxin lethal factor-related metalloendopeptidase [Bacillus sp. PS06]|uniref:anthrax toxin lethal factor-related metalloendopeptidase n=1 Tax=Bacillus sp. PS06 TaxID=2764176 RepID=UPI00177CF573|nr:toxin [Bacillus sp. PS06]MBD8068083.1 toxin [Bacillus sp. PS06]
MKKKFIVFTLILVFLIPMVKQNHSDASINGILLKDFVSLTFYTSKAFIPNYHLLEELIVLPETSFNENDAIEMIRRMGRVDSSILEALVSNHVKITFFNGKLTDQPSASHLKGLKPRGYSAKGPSWDDVPGIGGSKTVLVKIGHSHSGLGHGSLNLELHETAHTIDQHIFNMIRHDEDFHKIWREEAPKMFPNLAYFIDYPEEYFAEAFVYYYYSNDSREQLKQKAPLTEQFFSELIESIRLMNMDEQN